MLLQEHLLLFFQPVSEGKYELEKCSRGLTLLPREFVGSVLDKVMNGCLGNKAWPHGAITVGEAAAEYSYLGVKPSLVAANTKSSLRMHGWTATSPANYMQVQPASFIVLLLVYTLRKLCSALFFKFHVNLVNSAGQAVHGIQAGEFWCS